LANGWTCCFDGNGAPLWSLRFDAPIAKVCTLQGLTAVAQENGGLALVSPEGEVVRSRNLGSAISCLRTSEGRWPGDPLMLAGTESGRLLALEA
jgi:hypothetical protein